MTNLFRYILILSLIFPLITYGQRQKIDSLKNVLKSADDANYAHIYYILSKHYIRISNDTSSMYANKAIDYAKKDKNDKILAESYSILGAIEKYKGNYETALAYHLKSLKIKEYTKDEHGLTVTYNDLGILYKNMKRWREALIYYQQSNKLAKKLNLGVPISHTFNNLGTIYNEIGVYDSAMLSYDSAYFYAKKVNNTNAISIVLANIGDIHFTHRRYDSALDAFKQCLYYDKLNEDKYGMALSYMQLARTYNITGILDKALKHIDSADEISEKEDLLRERIDILYVRSSIEENAGDLRAAIEHNRSAYALKDSLLNQETSKQISELQTKYETEKKEQQIALQKADISRRNYIIVGISALFIVATLLGFYMYSRYKFKQKDKLQQEIIKQQELATQAVIIAEERERKRIAGDLHDGVGQTMSAAKMNLSAISRDIPFADDAQRSAFDKAMALVDEGCKEVRTVSHNIMPNALLKTGLATAIRDFLNKIDNKVLKVNLYTDGLNERLPSNTETVLYRVVQECVNNAIKHAEANTLDMTLIKDEEGISITIEDNGKGFEINAAKKKDGIGLQNLTTRIQYLKGTIEWDTAPGKGTVVTIQIPETTV